VLGLMTRTTTSLIGVDFGTCSLRAVQLKRKGDGWHIHHFVNVETEPTTPEPPDLDYQAQMQLAFGPATFTGNRTALVLSPPDVEYQLLDVPSALIDKPPAELRSALGFELDRQMPWPAAESEIAAWPVKPGQTGNTKAMVVAARISSVQRWLSLLESQQLACLHADVVPNAMIHVCSPQLDAATSPPDSTLWGIIDIGFQSARLYLINAGRPVYARVVRGGGRELTETLAAALHVDFRIAEQYKRIYGIRKSDRGFRSVAGGLTRIDEQQLPAVLYAIVRRTLEEMAKEIERSCQFALGQLPGVSAGPIFLIGGGARLGGLLDILSDHLGVPVSLPDPVPALATAPADGSGKGSPACNRANFPVLAACAGLAMTQEDAS